jgi:hypothetical protein
LLFKSGSAFIFQFYFFNLFIVGIFACCNPTKDFVHLEFKEAKERKINILSFTGQTVKQVNLNGKKQVLDLSELPTGMYFIQVAEADKIHTIKLVKH